MAKRKDKYRERWARAGYPFGPPPRRAPGFFARVRREVARIEKSLKR